ncbi:glycosyltransferase family 61 protein [Methylobacterium sp. J-068]|uniref:glycosyltransferase family 61 protein n=1 Tax=Methylobacterium sp. J-068 TaxID=2836649 RepID=UPI001FBAEA27|nr:glycosyltransferase family 61 protein [Methylobacterium sp. J-068]MCJ2034686.1 glycosyltransferase family 61 protein [Methylobacterium sp. J-068]
MARFLGVPAVAALLPRPGAILILCDRPDPDLAFFHAHFIQASLCLVTGDPDLESQVPAGIAVACGPVGDRRWLQELAAFHGPNLVIDQRDDAKADGTPAERALAFVVFHRALARGGVQALRIPARSRFGGSVTRALARRLAGAARLPRHAPAQNHYRILAKPAAPATPIRILTADDIPDNGRTAEAVTIAAPTYRRAEAELIDAPAWIAECVSFYAGRDVVPRPARVHRFREARVFGYGLVQVGDAVVEESLINRDRTHLLGALALAPAGAQVHHTLPRPRRIPGRTVHLWQMWAENYGHWLIECLPRLHVAARAGLLDGARVAVQAVPGMQALYRETLAVLGIGEDRIVWLTQREVIFEELVYPSPITRQPITKSPLVIDAASDLRDRIGPPAEILPERIYVSRNRSGRRRLVNEEAVIALLTARGYGVVHPETLPFARQVQVFAAARFVVGGMGAALANLAFGPAGLRCLLLTNRDMLDDFFLDLVGLKDGTYVSIHGTSLAPELAMHSDYTIDLDTLRDALDRHGF